MLTVTVAAKEKFKEILRKQTTDPGMAMRIISSPSAPNQFEFVVDRKKEEDEVVKDEKGRDILLIAPDLAPRLKGTLIDYDRTSRIVGFTISELGPDT